MQIASGHMVESSMKHFDTPKNSNEACVEAGSLAEHFENRKSKPQSMQQSNREFTQWNKKIDAKKQPKNQISRLNNDLGGFNEKKFEQIPGKI